MGGIPVTQLVFHHKHHHLPPASEKVLPVQLYGLSGQRRRYICYRESCD